MRHCHLCIVLTAVELALNTEHLSVKNAPADVDCGGGGCGAVCSKGEGCIVSSDCTTGSCLGGVCAQPTTCSNRVKDAGEGDVDCGGHCDRQCGVAGTCNLNSDCISNVCRYGACANAPTCYNNIKDSRETGRGGRSVPHAERSAQC